MCSTSLEQTISQQRSRSWTWTNRTFSWSTCMPHFRSLNSSTLVWYWTGMRRYVRWTMRDGQLSTCTNISLILSSWPKLQAQDPLFASWLISALYFKLHIYFFCFSPGGVCEKCCEIHLILFFQKHLLHSMPEFILCLMCGKWLWCGVYAMRNWKPVDSEVPPKSVPDNSSSSMPAWDACGADGLRYVFRL